LTWYRVSPFMTWSPRARAHASGARGGAGGALQSHHAHLLHPRTECKARREFKQKRLQAAGAKPGARGALGSARGRGSEPACLRRPRRRTVSRRPRRAMTLPALARAARQLTRAARQRPPRGCSPPTTTTPTTLPGAHEQAREAGLVGSSAARPRVKEGGGAGRAGREGRAGPFWTET
jgi:hypothetical protein